ncbi:TetR/AcrR family transcriptional regulator [Nocardia sp. NEAU-351]|uniref:TetR/AcrR family transcriptional regulator n=2 Tax=Nocardia bovistercoris TaxID=2785916 RepID=A0A931N417_9NOCA|nr:TetR/AcrR family transcriptional regulator [Nocardia bovistercoris]MBH0777786.1 TetR/AcrR family transcriptional regulator [Nocardia bovistercoris]
MARAGLTADRITEVAAALADEIGFDAVTMSEVARVFGVKDASLYSHVRNLRELRARIAAAAAAEKSELIADAVAGRSGKAALRAFADTYREYALAHPGRYAATQTPFDPDIGVDFPGAVRAVELTYGMLRGYHLSEPDLTDAVRLLRSTFHGFTALEAAGGFGHARPTASSWDRVVDALHQTLTRWPAAQVNP